MYRVMVPSTDKEIHDRRIALASCIIHSFDATLRGSNCGTSGRSRRKAILQNI